MSSILPWPCFEASQRLLFATEESSSEILVKPFMLSTLNKFNVRNGFTRRSSSHVPIPNVPPSSSCLTNLITSALYSASGRDIGSLVRPWQCLARGRRLSRSGSATAKRHRTVSGGASANGHALSTIHTCPATKIRLKPGRAARSAFRRYLPSTNRTPWLG
jgi:hypothetical protein